MAVREILAVLNANIDVDTTETIHAGMAIARKTADGKATPAVRGGAMVYIGVAADDTTEISNTMIQVDPVGATGLVDNSDGYKTFVEENNGYFVAWKRGLGGFLNETVANINNLTDVNTTGTGASKARRGLGYYSTPSSQLIVDTVLNAGTSSASQDRTAGALAINDVLCESAEVAGYFVELTNTSHGTQRARIDKIFGDAVVSATINSASIGTKLCQITLL